MPIKWASSGAASALLVLSTVLASWNWYLQPERGQAWAASLLLVGGMALVFGIARRISTTGPKRRGAAESISDGIVFAALMLAFSLAAKLVSVFSGADTGDLSQRLTPLSTLQCDRASVQAVQRLAGWTWVLTGLVFAIV